MDIKKRKIFKKGLIIIGVLSALLITGLVILFLSLGSIVKIGIETVLPKITGTSVSIKSFSLNPLTGKLYIKDLAVGNPEGYDSPYAFQLSKLNVAVSVSSLFSDKIIIREILVDGVKVAYETKFSESNIGKIKKNVDSFVKKGKGEEESSEKKAEDKEKPAKKFQINELKFTNGEVTVIAKILNTGAGTTLPLPDIRLTDIGKDSEKGSSLPEVAEHIYNALYEAILEAVKSIGDIDIGEKAEKALKSLQDMF